VVAELLVKVWTTYHVLEMDEARHFKSGLRNETEEY